MDVLDKLQFEFSGGTFLKIELINMSLVVRQINVWNITKVCQTDRRRDREYYHNDSFCWGLKNNEFAFLQTDQCWIKNIFEKVKTYTW